MSTKWTMVRITKATAARLRSLKERFDAAETLPEGLDVSEQDRFGIPLSLLIDWLITQEEKHRERGRRKKAPQVDA